MRLVAALVVASSADALRSNLVPRRAARIVVASTRAAVRAPARMGLLDDIKAKFGGASKPAPTPMPDVVIKEDYTLAVAFLVGGVVLTSLGSPLLWGAGSLPGVLILLLGVLFAVQAGRIRFVFDGDAFELKTRTSGADTDGASGGLQQAGENVVVGGANRWRYSTFVNWDFFPSGWLEQGLPPILVYFKETQTPRDQWDVGPGKAANAPDKIASGAVPGQVHFFPALCDCKQLKEQFELRGCAKLPPAARTSK
ncbi:hypothetical protein KFE25_003644 [Diacronema lutheri]|uniref:Uncharacterized protein n=1 Tax=Diacronema lutheri TaxID=2081491 RepID=A0A8J6C902_DIALT|nr:hypothetical protein KFE25_003644 [Diacronema lutheri]